MQLSSNCTFFQTIEHIVDIIHTTWDFHWLLLNEEDFGLQNLASLVLSDQSVAQCIFLCRHPCPLKTKREKEYYVLIICFIRKLLLVNRYIGIRRVHPGPCLKIKNWTPIFYRFSQEMLHKMFVFLIRTLLNVFWKILLKLSFGY